MPVSPEQRERDSGGEVKVSTARATRDAADAVERRRTPRTPSRDIRETVKVYPFGISWSRLDDAARGLNLPVAIVREPEDADVVITLKNYYRRKTPRLRNAESNGVPIYAPPNNSTSPIAAAPTPV